ncbi:MAG: hypothetical protein AAGD43_17795 [Pseudomonadota bacterium]
MSKRISIALGGSDVEGLIGWGVLQRLFEDEEIEIAAISASGSGCFSAIAVAQGLSHNGREGAVDRLSAMWRDIVLSWNKSVSDPDPWQMLMPLLAAAQQAEETMTGDPYFFSPEVINPLNMNPLWNIAEAFLPELGRDTIEVFLAAVNVNTGSKRIFSGDEISHDTVRAATCAPWRNAAVDIDGDFFWGTGLNAAPLFPLFGLALPQDLFCVVPRISRENRPPESGEAIASRLAALTSISALQAELRSIDFVQRLADSGAIEAASFRLLRVHGTVIAPPARTWPDASALYEDPSVSDALYQHGYNSAAAWLAANKADIGQRSSLDISSLL